MGPSHRPSARVPQEDSPAVANLWQRVFRRREPLLAESLGDSFDEVLLGDRKGNRPESRGPDS